MEKRPVYGSTKHHIIIDRERKTTVLSDGTNSIELPLFSCQVYSQPNSHSLVLLCNPEKGNAVCITMKSLSVVKVREVVGRVIGLDHVTGNFLLKHSSCHDNTSSHHGNTSCIRHDDTSPDHTIWKYHPDGNSIEVYQNPCVASVQTLPITWVTVINTRDVVIATRTSRILFVSDGVITSNMRVNHQVHVISILSDILIRVYHGDTSTVLTIPILSPHQQVTDQGSSSTNGCLSSCQKIKMQELGLLAEERSRCEDKRRFVETMWKGLFELTPPQRIDESSFVREFTKDGSFNVENNAHFQKNLHDMLELQIRQKPNDLSTDCLANLLRLSRS